MGSQQVCLIINFKRKSDGVPNNNFRPLAWLFFKIDARQRPPHLAVEHTFRSSNGGWGDDLSEGSGGEGRGLERGGEGEDATPKTAPSFIKYLVDVAFASSSSPGNGLLLSLLLNPVFPSVTEGDWFSSLYYGKLLCLIAGRHTSAYVPFYGGWVGRFP